MTRFLHRLDILAAATLIAIAFAAPAPLSAAAVEEPAKPTDAKSDKKTDDKSGAKPAETKAPDAKPADSKSDKKSDYDFRNGYKQAYDLIYKKRDYAGGLAILRTLGHDAHPDVANLIGFSSRKLGRTEDAKLWYEKALASDPSHTRTWQYYGLWHLERGDRAKAEEHLEKIRLICGQGCEDYTSLRDALDDKSTY